MKYMIKSTAFLCLTFLFLVSFASAQNYYKSETTLNLTVSIVGTRIEIFPTDLTLAKGQVANFEITLIKGTNVMDATINGTVVKPDGTVDYNISFTYQGFGIYRSENYTFTKVGSYNLTFLVKSNTIGEHTLKVCIHVPKLSLYANLVGGTEYKTGEEVRIIAQTKDEDGFPITGAVSRLTIYLPNNTKWKTGVAMSELENGLYYWNGTLPSVEGIYTVWINASYGTEWTTDSQTFHVAKWTTDIAEIKEIVKETKTLLEDMEDYVKRIPGISNAIGSLASAIDSLGFAHSQSFLISVTVMSILGFGVVVMIYLTLKGKRKEEEGGWF